MITSPIFTKQEFTFIGQTTKDNKFYEFSKILYPQTNIDIVKTFIKCYKLMISVYSEMESEDIKEKLLKYLNDLKELDIQCNRFLLQNEKGFNNVILSKKVSSFYLENKFDIDNFIAFTYKFGKLQRLFNPDEEIGTY